MGLFDLLTGSPGGPNVALPPLEKRNLRESFFELLQEFSTFPASQNLFLVKILISQSAMKKKTESKIFF